MIQMSEPEDTGPTVERIRRYPLWFARLANLVIGWTDMYCSGGCGYPVTGFYYVDVDNIEGVPVSMMVCSKDGDCALAASDLSVLDQNGFRYSEVRPWLISLSRDVDRYRLHFSRN